MAGLVPAIHAVMPQQALVGFAPALQASKALERCESIGKLASFDARDCVDSRDKPGHDVALGEWSYEVVDAKLARKTKGGAVPAFRALPP